MKMNDSGSLISGLENDSTSKGDEPESREQAPASAGRLKLEGWLNKNMKIEMTDGRTLVGIFLCTDKGRNVILGSCSEYLKMDDEDCLEEDPRYLGLAMVPGHHIVSIHIDDTTSLSSDIL